MQDESSGEQTGLHDSLWANVLIPLIALGVIGAGGWYLFGDFFRSNQSNGAAESAAFSYSEQPEDVCVNDRVVEKVAHLVARHITERKVQRPDPSDQIDGFRAVAQLLDKQNGLLTSAEEFEHRIVLGSITFEGHNVESKQVWCSGTASMQDIADENGDAHYDAKPRLRYKVQQTVDGSDDLVTVEGNEDIDRAGFQWASADGRAISDSDNESISNSED